LDPRVAKETMVPKVIVVSKDSHPTSQVPLEPEDIRVDQVHMVRLVPSV
jgi:hypothetical protein